LRATLGALATGISRNDLATRAAAQSQNYRAGGGSLLRMLVWPEASNAQNNMAAVSSDGSTVCVLILRLEGFNR